MTTRGVLFDLDGVLVDSAALHLQAYERVFSDVGIEFPDAARSAVLCGKPRSQVIELAVPSADAELKRQLTDAKPGALEAVLANERDCSMPGAADAVRALDRVGIPMGVVTNSRTPEIWLSRAGLSPYMRAVVSADDVASPKPSPEGYLLCAERLHVEPGHCLAIEDAYDGWLAATNAGMQVVVVGKERPQWLDAETELMHRLDATGILQRLGH